MAVFPRPQPQTQVPQVNAALGALGGTRQMMMRLLAQRRPDVAAMLGGMTEQQIGQRASEQLQSNPLFAEFVRENQGKSALQILRDYGVNI